MTRYQHSRDTAMFLLFSTYPPRVSLEVPCSLSTHSLLCSPHIFPARSPLLQDAVSILARELQAASCDSGNAAQRVAFFFSQAFSARLAGTGMQAYIQSGIPDDPKEFDAAWMHYTTTTPLSHFFLCTTQRTILHALRQAARELPVKGRSRPMERLHLIDMNVEAMHLWLALIRWLAMRPQGAPHSFRITVVDIQAPSTPKEMVQARQGLAMQVRKAHAVGE